MRNLPHNPTKKQQLFIDVVFDFYGKGMGKKDNPNCKTLALHLMGKRRGIKLTDEQKCDLWYIKENLQDRVYVESFSNPLKS